MKNIKKVRDPISVILSRFVLGVIFFIAGMHGFMEFPWIETSIGAEFSQSLGELENHHLFYMLKGSELLLGMALVMNFFVQTVLLMVLPVIAGIIVFNFSVSAGFGIASLLFLIPLFVLFRFYRETFIAFFRPQIYANHLGETTPQILTIDEVEEKAPKMVSDFQAIYNRVN